MENFDYYAYVKFTKVKVIKVKGENKKEAEESVRDLLEKTNAYELNMPIVSRSYSICQIKKIKRKK